MQCRKKCRCYLKPADTVLNNVHVLIVPLLYPGNPSGTVRSAKKR